LAAEDLAEKRRKQNESLSLTGIKLKQYWLKLNLQLMKITKEITLLEAEDFKDQMDCQMNGEDTDHEFTRK